MKSTILFGTSNQHKLTEAKSILSDFVVCSPKDLGYDLHIDEPFDTLQANALHKANTIKTHTGYDCFAEDTGLEVAALDGAPGVRTARYAGPQCNASDNMKLLLKSLENLPNRTARFRSVIALHWQGQVYFFEGVLKGSIATEMTGNSGFGYDPIFVPEGYACSLASMASLEKNKISHRAKALAALTKFLIPSF